jgi:GMP synthase-like glutamine amidotransferase
MSGKVLVLDCYLDDTGCADNFLRCLGQVETSVARPSHGDVPADLDGVAALIVTGSAASVLDELDWALAVEALTRRALDERVPVLGVCFGHQLLARAAFGPERVRRGSPGELGWIEVDRLVPHPLLAGFPERFETFASHFDEVTKPLEGARVLAATEACPVQAYALDDVPAWGVQFHQEIRLPEARDLIHRRSEGFGLDPETLLPNERDTSQLCPRLIANFLSLAEAELWNQRLG